jgi:hypothetical protein
MSLKPIMLGLEETPLDDAQEMNEHDKAFEASINAAGNEIAPVEQDSDFNSLVNAEEAGIKTANEITEETEASTALEAIASFLNASMESHTFDKVTLSMANVAVESICERVHFNSTKVAFSMETYSADPKKTLDVALEDIRERANAIWDSVKVKIASIARYLGEKMNYFKRNLAKLKARTDRLESEVNKHTSSEEAKSKFLKPDNWFINLMYSDKAMPVGLDGVGKAVESLLTENRKIATGTVDTYTKWLLTNCKNGSVEDFSTLKVHKDDFLLSGSTAFNRSIEMLKPKGDNMFYRSKELPGNKAFYTEIQPKDKSGAGSIKMLNDVNFFMDNYDPQSYKLRLKKISEIQASSAVTWAFATAALAVIGFSTIATGMAAGTLGYGLMSYLNNNKSKVENTGHELSIDKDMLFHTLTIAEAKKVISDTRAGIKALQSWYTEVFEKNWKGDELDHIFNNVIGTNRVEVNNSTNFRSLKLYCSALMNLMYNVTTNIHMYAFRTYNSMLNYVDKSIRQY